MKKKFKYQDAADRIIDMIKSGDVDDKLPGERVLARVTGYSYMTIRKALDFLDKNGIIRKSPKRGTFAVKAEKTMSGLKKIALIDGADAAFAHSRTLICELQKHAQLFHFKIIKTKAAEVTGTFDGAIILRPYNNIFEDIAALKLLPSVIVESWFENSSCGIVCSDYYTSVHQTLEKIGNINMICYISDGEETWQEIMIRKALRMFSEKMKIELFESACSDISLLKSRDAWKVIYNQKDHNENTEADDDIESIEFITPDGVLFASLISRFREIAFDTNKILKEIIDGGRVLRCIVKMDEIIK